MTAKEKLLDLATKLKENGLPIILLQDPVTDTPSITFTMVVASFVMCILAVNGLANLDFASCKELLTLTGAGYLGRQTQKLFSGSEEEVQTPPTPKEGEDK